MLRYKIDHLHEIDDVCGARWFTALRPRLLRGCLGTGDTNVADDSGGLAGLAGLKWRLRWSEEEEELSRAASAGASLVLWAAASDDLGALHELLRAGAAVDVAESEGFPPLGIAWGMTPLLAAMSFASWEVVSALLAASADPLRRDTAWSMDAVMHAALHSRAENVQRYLEEFPNWDLERQNKYQMTALNFAARYGSGEPALSTVNALLAAGANRSTCDERGTLAIHHASMGADCR